VHPVLVVLAWRRVHRRWPDAAGLLAILLHDVGYWGCPNMDGPEGRNHPQWGAKIAGLFSKRAAALIRGHSSRYAAARGEPVSDLFLPDKVCVLFESRWFYLLRARLTGELREYLLNSPREIRQCGARCWLAWYQTEVARKLESHEKSFCKLYGGHWTDQVIGSL
jgi:hypothetical protein